MHIDVKVYVSEKSGSPCRAARLVPVLLAADRSSEYRPFQAGSAARAGAVATRPPPTIMDTAVRASIVVRRLMSVTLSPVMPDPSGYAVDRLRVSGSREWCREVTAPAASARSTGP